MPLTITPEIIAKLRAVTLEAGEKILEIYATDFEVFEKQDESPVTVADQAAEAIITPVLQSIWPDVPVVGEEAASEGDIPDISKGAFWLVDPVDGERGHAPADRPGHDVREPHPAQERGQGHPDDGRGVEDGPVAWVDHRVDAS